MKLLFFLYLVLLSSCSKESRDVKLNNDLDNLKDEVVFEALSVRTSLVGGENTIPVATVDFATLQPKQSGIQDLIITNGLSTDLVFGSNDIDASSISPFVMTESCSNKTIARNRLCKLSFSVLNTPNSIETVLTKSLTIKGSVIQLTATLAADINPFNGIIVSPNSLDFGLMKPGENKELSIAVTNKSSSTQLISAPIISNPKISITSNTCSSLARSRSCSIKIRYSASTDESVIQQSFTSIANNEIKHSALVQSPTVSEPQVLTINPAIASSNLSLNEPQIQNSTLSFTNTGTVELPSPVQAIAQPSVGVVINSVSCTGGLSRGRNCSVSYSLNSSLLAGGISSVQLRLQSGAIASNSHTINLNVTKLAVPCSVSDVQANGWNTDNHLTISGMKTGSDVSQCIVQSCNQYFSVNSSSKSCSADACTVDNAPTFGVNLSNVSSVFGNTPNCVVSSCSNPSLFDISPDQKSCVDKPLDCTLADAQSNGWNITNAQTATGTKVGTNLTQCSVSVCNTNFELNSTNKTCDAISCTLVNASGNGVTSILNVATVSGTLPNCSVSSCNANYKPATDSKSCVAKLCNELNAGELSVLGFNTTGATILGTYPSCSLTCNSSLQQLAADSKSCVDKTPTGSIAFVQAYTKTLTGNLLNITQTNAQQIQFYSDASCTTTGSALSMPLTQTSITVSSGDGTKTVYAKLLNGTASSSCLSSSIILDQTAPALVITSPLNNANQAANSLTVTGTCSEVNNPTVQVGITINSVTQNVNCSSGTFSSVFDISSLTAGTYLISASATDLATNTGTTSINFNRVVCTSLQTLSGNTCIDNTPTGSIAFAQQYTRNLSGNTLLVNHTSAQQIEFFSDIACSQSSGVQSINSSYEIILTDSDGVKTIYARFINGTQRSGCLSSSIILDRQEPGTFVVALNTPNTTSTSAAPVVTIGSVSDFGLSGIYSLEYGIGTSTTTANHVSFFIIPTNSTSFTASVANGFLPMGTVFNSTTQYYTLIRATDNAGNTKIISSEAWTYEEPNLLAASFVLYGGRSATSGSLFMWRTDGTSAGTLQVGSQQIVSSWRGIKYKDRIWFTGFDSADNHELWVTDGTSAGTQKFMSIYPGASNGLDNSNTKFTVCNNLLFFAANDSAASVELWRTDGTTAGTFRVVDAYPGVQPGISNTNNFMWCVGGDKLLFQARNASETGFWMVTDGTTLGTRRFHTLFSGVPTDIRGGSNSTAVIGNKVYFHNLTNAQNVGFGHLSIADFDTYTVTYYRMMGQTGTVTVVGNVQDMVAIDGKIYFQGAQGAQSTPGAEPWVSDGTAAGTFQLAEICSGTCSSIPSAWFRHGPNQILFRAYNGSSQDVYITNGTTAGTSILKKINPSGDSAAFYNYAKFNGKTYFDANDGTFGRELWVTDGTTAGTVMVKDINPGTAASLPRAIREVNGRLVFVATHASFGAEIWSSDGTGVGTTQVRDASPGTTGSVFIFAENGAFLGL